MSCLGRERAFEHYARQHGTPVSLIRLNYACELRYGVLVDLAQKVMTGAEIDLSMGYFNAIWQGDANAMSIASLVDASSPAFIVNIAGPEILSVRKTADEFGKLLDKPPRFTGTERSDALLSKGQMAHQRYGKPTVSVPQMVTWIADWLKRGGLTLNKPTHFQTRDGKF
jgi:hypothetical protein